MPAMKKLNMTHFAANESHPGYFTIGGEDALGKRIEPLQVPEDVFLAASKSALKPALEAILNDCIAELGDFRDSITVAKDHATSAFHNFEAQVRRKFGVTTSQLVNRKLPAQPTTVPTGSATWSAPVTTTDIATQ